LLARALPAVLLVVTLYAAQPLEETRDCVRRVRLTSFPEIQQAQIEITPLTSRSDFFRARPRFTDLLTRRHIRYVLLANPAGELLDMPDGGRAAIIAHEVAHILYYQSGSRWRLMGLLRLIRLKDEAKWERAADREAIRRGYGSGLIEYRKWLYGNAPAKAAQRKQRIYLTPPEIAAEMAAGRR
jgi:hypothetical protein